MRQTVIGITTVGGLGNILLNRQRINRTVFFYCIAEQDLYGILIRRATSCRRNTNCSALVGVPNQVRVIVAEINGFSVPIAVDFQLISICQRKRTVFSCLPSRQPFFVQNIRHAISRIRTRNKRPVHICLFCRDSSGSQPTVRTVDFGIHIGCQILHARRQTNDPLRVCLAVQTNRRSVCGNTRSIQFNFDLILNI